MVYFRLNISAPKGIGINKCSKLNGGRNSSGHSVELLKSRNVGKDEGLAIYFNTSSSSEINVTKPGKIFQYFISDNYIIPEGVEMKTFLLFFNYQANIAISKTVNKRLEHPFNQCYNDVRFKAADKTLVDKIINSNTSYLQVTCFNLCQEAHMSRICNCTFYGFLRYNGMYDLGKDCNKGVKNDCLKSEDKFNKVKKCIDKCPLECDSLDFSYSVQTYNLIDYLSTIKIFYNSLKYTEISQIAKVTPTDVVANFGGTLGD